MSNGIACVDLEPEKSKEGKGKLRKISMGRTSIPCVDIVFTLGCRLFPSTESASLSLSLALSTLVI